MWKRDGSSETLNCIGEHVMTCNYTFTPEYDSDGEYKCKGYNMVRTVQKEMESTSVKLTTGRRMKSHPYHVMRFSFYFDCHFQTLPQCISSHTVPK